MSEILLLSDMDFNALMALTGLICGLMVSSFASIILKITL